MNNNKTLTDIFSGSLFQIPDYQRGYAWEKKQCRDFIQDIDALIDDNIDSHYTGTIVVYRHPQNLKQRYGIDDFPVLDVVDGQQRLTTCCLYLSVVIKSLISQVDPEYQSASVTFLHNGTTCRITPGNETKDIFFDLLSKGKPNTPIRFPHEQRLIDAITLFKSHIEQQLTQRKNNAVSYLKNLYNAITQRLRFTYYEIPRECDIGMTFELMNSRGKDLSVLELLKNYLMYWIARNAENKHARTNLLNKHWKDAYINLGRCEGDEDQYLRIVWTLHHDPIAANWGGYAGFKNDNCIPLRSFHRRKKEDVSEFIDTLAQGLADLSSHYAAITKPDDSSDNDARLWLEKICNTGNTANFLPLLVAARHSLLDNRITQNNYIDLLQRLERFAYRVFLFSGRRSDAGKKAFYRWGHELFNNKAQLNNILIWIDELTRYYSPESDFITRCEKIENWYNARIRLRYTLFEYELHLLTEEGNGKPPHLQWSDLNDSTIEHILPQNPNSNSGWLRAWPDPDRQEKLHDIGNLVLTQNNSNYRNFEFSRKKGAPGISPSYSNSDIRQERKLSRYDDWTPSEFQARRIDIVTWIKNRWKTERDVTAATIVLDISNQDDDTIDDQALATLP
jgi:hypothetical protein